MTDIRIKRLSLENFKCHASLVLDFAGGNASIYGDNATGKTSIYDALTWLLFGKDSAGNGEKNIEIKPLGATVKCDHQALTAVEAVLTVNGEDVTLRRTYKEVWTTKRGSAEASYDGNTSEYYIDGVPCKKNAFSAYMDGLVSEDTFRLLTSVRHFASGISWQERRKVLFDVAGVMDDGQILASDEKFAPLIEGMGKLSLDDYRKKLTAEKKQQVGAKTEIPARISECQKTIADVEGIDFDAVREEMTALTARQDNLAEQIMAIEHDRAAEQKRLEIRELQAQQIELVTENEKYRIGQTCPVDTDAMKKRLGELTARLSSRKSKLAMLEASLRHHDKKIEDSRTRWIAVNGEKFSGGKCPTCGQALPADQLRAATDRFEATKKQRLREIEQTAQLQKNAKALAECQIEDVKAEIEKIEEEIADMGTTIGVAEAMKTEPRDMDDYEARYEALQDAILALSDELMAITDNSLEAKESLSGELSEVKEKIKEAMAVVSKEAMLDYAKQRMESLREDAANAAKRLDAIEGMLYLMDEYSRYKTKFVEDSINSLFRIARFRLFREQVNGGVEDRCDVVLDGVPYVGLNNGAKINVGIDIINTLSRAYGVWVPLFVDNAESVTRLEGSAGQIIRLVVSENDKELRIENEN